MIDESKRNLARSVRAFKHEVVDIQLVPYADATFDAVIANHMLYHVPDLKKGMSEMRRILKELCVFIQHEIDALGAI
jgi:ubiquinone/menaquinone biosynthesis C-methylase UbiE